MLGEICHRDSCAGNPAQEPKTFEATFSRSVFYRAAGECGIWGAST